MKWIFNERTITMNGYLTPKSGRDQSETEVLAYFFYSPAINWPGVSALSIDERGNPSNLISVHTEYKISIYDSDDQSHSVSLASFTGSSDKGFGYSYTTEVIDDKNPASNSGVLPTESGTFYLQFDWYYLLSNLKRAGFDGGESGRIPTDGQDLRDYPMEISWSIKVTPHKYKPFLSEFYGALDDTVPYTGGYYFIPFQKPDRVGTIASVWGRAAVVQAPTDGLAHNIMSMMNYQPSLVYTLTVGSLATTYPITSLTSLSVGTTFYIRLPYNEIQILAGDRRVSGLIADQGLGIRVQIYWQPMFGDTKYYLGDFGDNHGLHLHDDDGYHFAHDISLFRGVVPIHRKRTPNLNVEYENDSIRMSWDPSEVYDCYGEPTLVYGLALVDSTYYNRTIYYTDISTKKERRCRGRQRPREKLVWFGEVDMYDEEAFVDDASRTLRNYLPKKLQWYYDNYDDPFVYVRPIIGTYRANLDNPKWLFASDTYYKIDLQ